MPLIVAFALLFGRPTQQDEPATRASAPMASIEFRYDRPGLSVPRFRVLVREDGSGSYSNDVSSAGTAAGSGGPSESAATAHVDQAVQLSAATAEKIFHTARAEKLFNIACASRAKNIADTGTKVLRYEGSDGAGMCTYNYTENKDIVMLTDLFLAMGTTLEEGRKLEFKHRYDRLGVDAELDVLAQANTAGRAVELSLIAPQLRELANDGDLMQRARLRATKLLERAAEGK